MDHVNIIYEHYVTMKHFYKVIALYSSMVKTSQYFVQSNVIMWCILKGQHSTVYRVF